MARSKSVILSAAEKKEIVSGLRVKIKDLQATIKARALTNKAANKEHEKKAAAGAKELAALQKQLASVTAKKK